MPISLLVLAKDMSAGAMMALNTPDEIPYRIAMRMRPGAVDAPNTQKQRMELMAHMMARRLSGP
jgi:hypothetical protein